jgi:L-ascorbate metabolism protein UlaG (beta-lactamase superfamily)
MVRSTAPLLLPLLLLAACNNAMPPAPAPSVTPPASDAAATPSASAVVADAAPPKAPPTVTDTFTTPAGELTVTPIHHATMLLRLGDKAIYIDPAAADASYEGLPKADFVFVTDIHPDHMDPAGLAKVQKADTVLVGPPAVNEKMPMKIVMKNGDTHDFGAFKVEAVPMYNLTRGPEAGKLFHDKGRGDGFVFTFVGKAGAKAADGGTMASRLYVSGDTECTPEMKALKNIDVAFVCMNLPYTMPPAEAATCINAFKPKVVFPFHYKGSNLDELSAAIKPGSGIDVRKREWY